MSHKLLVSSGFLTGEYESLQDVYGRTRKPVTDVTTQEEALTREFPGVAWLHGGDVSPPQIVPHRPKEEQFGNTGRTQYVHGLRK